MIYAIDFGTSNSLLAAAEKGSRLEPVPLDPDAPDPTVLRSILYFPSRDNVFYGSRAVKEFADRDLEGRLLRSFKRFLPQRSFIGTFIDERPMNLEDIIAAFLREMRVRANKHFGQDVDSVVMGRPARFSMEDDADLFAQGRLEQAARLAGFKHIEFMPEPLAAAREFREGVHGVKAKGTKTERLAFVGDFGGGTSDYSVLRLHSGKFHPSDVLGMGGVPVAGDAFDGAVMRHRISRHFGASVRYQVPFGSNVLTMPRGLMEKLCSPAEIAILRKRDTMEFFKNVQQWSLGKEDKSAMERLFALVNDQLGFPVFEEIERTKRELNRALKAGESTPPEAVFEFKHPEFTVRDKYTRTEFESWSENQLEQIVSAMDATLTSAKLSPDQIDVVYLTGGTAKVAAIRKAFVSRFGEDKLVERNHFHSIVEGLAEHAASL